MRGASKQLFSQAQSLIPGGVNSPVRAFKAVGTDPVFIDRAKGCQVVDVDGNSYIDYVCSWGPLILGHAHPEVLAAINQSALKGTSYGAPCRQEVEMALMICEAFPSIDKVRMVNSGTEATMSAIRLARAFTGRSKVIKFEGCYHGHADAFLIKAGSGLLTSGVPTSPGIPQELAAYTLIAQYNDLQSVQILFEEHFNDIAAVIVEPVAGNMGLVLPDPQFLQGLRAITDQYGSLLIFDEVITGFRLTYGGYQNIVGIKPDLTTLGKIIGGGLPVGAYGGRREIMDLVAPQGPVYQAGTLSGNPLAMAAGAATLRILKDGAIYERLDQRCERLVQGLVNAFADAGEKIGINRIGSMFSVFFTGQKVNSYKAVMSCDTERYAAYFRAMLQLGVYFPPAQFEVSFVSLAHEEEDIDSTVARTRLALETLP
ncbi:MAG TPA: glutamate-1-semialdehyde-2,1-aminomutase [Syntrophomonas sp.]|jgi:glutamate-1-semialdehyde 2,1-aminomutase|nr:glutamate-1-semialdehyde-2,1-aminomutase [Syntrophomonas sp.]